MSSSKSSYLVPHDHIVVGIIRGARGLKGELRVEPTTEFLERFDSGNALFVKGVSHEVIRSQQGRKGIVLLLSGIRNRDGADHVLGEQITVPDSDVIEPPEGLYFHYQILGLDVYREDLTYLGTISEIIQTGANDVYVVSLTDEPDVLLPVIPNVIINIELDNNKMIVSVPLGLDRNLA